MARILIVGRELSVAIALQRDLEPSEHHVIGYLVGAADVVAVVLQMRPDVVIVDLDRINEAEAIAMVEGFRQAIASSMLFLIDGVEPLPQAIAHVVETAVVLPKPWSTAQLLGALETALTNAPTNAPTNALTNVDPVGRNGLPDLAPAPAPDDPPAPTDPYRIVGAIAQRIRQSLDLDTILNTTALEVRQLLQVDRVIVYRFEPDWSGYVITESVEAPWPVMLGRNITDPCLSQEQCIAPYMQGHIASHDDIYAAGLAECYTRLLGQFSVRANLVIPVMAGTHLWGLLAAQHCQSPRHWLGWEIDLLRQLSSQISIAIQQSQIYQHTHLQAQRQQILNRILQTTRHSLDLPTIFQAVVSEVGVQMQMEHVQIAQYLPEREVWAIRGAYSPAPQQFPVDTNLEIADRNNLITAQLKQGNVVQLTDASAAVDPVNQEWAQIFPGAWLIVPLQMGASVWGALGLLRHPAPYVWSEWQIELVGAIADQLAIAIQQAELYRQVQRLNSDLESQVQIRTAQLRRALSFEAVLKQIADQVHDSLDEKRILQTVVEGLANVLGVDSCLTAVYDPGAATYRVSHEYPIPANEAARSPVDHPSFARDHHPQLAQGMSFQCCWGASCQDGDGDPQRCHSILAIPICDAQIVLSVLFLLRDQSDYFDSVEVRLVHQVANQCAIAIRQSRLYQAAQSQVADLERLNQLKDNFLSSISHELRTPISNIKMALQMIEISLKRAAIAPEVATPIQRYLQILQSESEREIRLISDLLDLSRLEAEISTLEPTTLDLRIWVPHIIERFTERAQRHQQTLVAQLPADLPLLRTDLICFQRIVSELVDNALKYSPDQATISVSGEAVLREIGSGEAIAPTPQAAAIQLSVINTGIAIAPEEFDRIFDRFYRIPSADPWRYSGTGVGLAIVKTLVAHLGATIQVSSQDNQTRFTVQFPQL